MIERAETLQEGKGGQPYAHPRKLDGSARPVFVDYNEATFPFTKFEVIATEGSVYVHLRGVIVGQNGAQFRAGAEPGFSMTETHYYLGLCHLAQGRRLDCFAEFERLAEKVWWAVPQRYREYRAWRRSERAKRPA